MSRALHESAFLSALLVTMQKGPMDYAISPFAQCEDERQGLKPSRKSRFSTLPEAFVGNTFSKRA